MPKKKTSPDKDFSICPQSYGIYLPCPVAQKFVEEFTEVFAQEFSQQFVEKFSEKFAKKFSEKFDQKYDQIYMKQKAKQKQFVSDMTVRLWNHTHDLQECVSITGLDEEKVRAILKKQNLL